LSYVYLEGIVKVDYVRVSFKRLEDRPLRHGVLKLTAIHDLKGLHTDSMDIFD